RAFVCALDCKDGGSGCCLFLFAASPRHACHGLQSAAEFGKLNPAQSAVRQRSPVSSSLGWLPLGETSRNCVSTSPKPWCWMEPTAAAPASPAETVRRTGRPVRRPRAGAEAGAPAIVPGKGTVLSVSHYAIIAQRTGSVLSPPDGCAGASGGGAPTQCTPPSLFYFLHPITDRSSSTKHDAERRIIHVFSRIGNLFSFCVPGHSRLWDTVNKYYVC
ncbi:unnamed protein product, partial [Ixodes pacificus]